MPALQRIADSAGRRQSRAGWKARARLGPKQAEQMGKLVDVWRNESALGTNDRAAGLLAQHAVEQLKVGKERDCPRNPGEFGGCPGRETFVRRV